MDYYLKDLTEESMHEALHDFTEEMFLTVFGQTLEDGTFISLVINFLMQLELFQNVVLN